MIIDGHEYILIMGKENNFSNSHVIPDLNSRFWTSYYQELKALTHFNLKDKEVHYASCGLGFSKGDFDVDNPGLKLALYEAVSHPCLPFKNDAVFLQSLEKAKDEIAEICRHQNHPIISETFHLFEDNDEKSHALIWMSSPVAEIKQSFLHYIEALSADRRKQARRLMRQYDENDAYSFDFSATPLTTSEIDFIIENSLKRWGRKEQNYALAQTLWAHVASQTIPGSAYFMRVYEGNTLLLIASYIMRGSTLTSQATCRNEDHLKSGLGTMVDFKTISILHDKKLASILDPTCRTSLNDPENIGVAKREVVNKDMLRPMICLTLQNSSDTGYPNFNATTGKWHLSKELHIEGRLK